MNNKPKILVTGGKGFLGQHIVARLLREGYEVRIFARESHPDESDGDNIEIVTGDIRDRAAVERAVQGCNQVIHLVSNFRKAASDKQQAYAINVEGTTNVLQACNAANVQRLVHCSTIGVHGNVQEIPADENSPFNPGDVYQQTKLEAEKNVWEHCRNTGLPVTVVRPISAFGPGDRRMLKLFRMIKKGRFVMVGKGDVLFQPSYIDDVAQGFLLCLESQRAIGEVFIVGGDEYLTLNELVQTIARQLNVSAPRLRVPMQPVVMAASVCERVCRPFDIEPPLHLRRVSFFQNNRAFCIDKAKKILDFQPRTNVEQGFKQTIQWYENQGWL